MVLIIYQLHVHIFLKEYKQILYTVRIESKYFLYESSTPMTKWRLLRFILRYKIETEAENNVIWPYI